ncbi:MAG: PDZ domain-containing protein [Acidobacteria bacterium]|nr:PDZ domain-containing protein [Acidobacteriota bacterium]
MSRRTRLLAVVTSTPLLLLVLVGGLLGATRPVTGQQGFEHLPVFWDVVRLTLGAYVETPDIEKVMDGAMRGLTDSLDPMSSYLAPAEVRAVESGAPLPAANPGITLSKQFYLRVIGVRDGSPAARAGLRSGDFIREIDGAPTRDMSVHTGTRMLAGAAESTVNLLVIRTNMAEPRPIPVTRELPAAMRATARRLAGGEAYLRVSSFGAGVADQIQSAIASLGAAANAGVIVDLRDTGDGTAEAGIAAARLFVASGTVATLASRNADPVKTDAAAGDGALRMPVVLIVSGGTAHGAEVFAAALVDNKRASLVGLPTAGLAAVQTLVRLPEGHGLMLTTARYVLADGTPIHARGLRPEVLVEVPVVPFDETPPATDATLAKAVEVLKASPR